MAKRRTRRSSKKAWLTPAQKQKLKTAGKWTALGLITYEAYLAMVHRRQVRRDAFNAALQRAHQLQKPLYVVGDPKGRLLARMLGPDFDCGDVCIDKRGCPECPTQIAGRPEEALATVPSDSAVVFATGLEYVDDLPRVFNELRRVSGGNVFTAGIEPWSLTAWLWPTAKRRILEAPPNTAYITWRELPWRPGPSTVERLNLSGGSVRGLRVAMGGY